MDEQSKSGGLETYPRRPSSFAQMQQAPQTQSTTPVLSMKAGGGGGAQRSSRHSRVPKKTTAEHGKDKAAQFIGYPNATSSSMYAIGM